MNRLIAFIGRKGSGKDTAARILVDNLWENVKFAGGLKAMLAGYLAYVGVDKKNIHHMLEGQFKEVPTWHFCAKTPRFAMQTLGTEWGRDIIGKDLWKDSCILRCQQFEDVVVTDARFQNEIEALQGIGGKIVRVTRAGVAKDDHESERYIDDLPADFEIANDGTIDELHAKVLQIVNNQ